MAINYTISYTFSPGTTISSSQVNTNFSDNANTWTGLEALTKSFSALRVDATPTATTDVSIKSYVDKLNAYRRPVLQYSSGTVVNLETGINGTSGQAQILFPDGTLRTDSTSSRINLTVSQTAAFSGTAQSGIDTGSVSNNTWYNVYAAKVTDSTTNFVTTASLLTPVQANFATLNSRLGTNGWVYLGLIAYGDNSGTANAVVKFAQSGNFTQFRNTCVANGTQGSGIRLATQGAAGTTLTYTYAAGTTISSAQIPSQVNMGYVLAGGNNTATEVVQMTEAAGNNRYFVGQGPGSGASYQFSAIVPIIDGVQVFSSSALNKHDVFLFAFWDGVLGIGANPLL